MSKLNKLVAVVISSLGIFIAQAPHADTAVSQPTGIKINGSSLEGGAAGELFTALEKGGADRWPGAPHGIAYRYKTPDGAIKGSVSATRVSNYVIELLVDSGSLTTDQANRLVTIQGAVAKQLYDLMEKAGFKKLAFTTGSTLSGDFINCNISKFSSVKPYCEFKGLSSN